VRTLCDRARTPRSDLTSPSTGNESETQAQLATTDAVEGCVLTATCYYARPPAFWSLC